MKQYLALSILVGAITFAGLALFIDNSYGKFNNLKSAVDAQREQNAALDSRVKELQQKVFALKSDPRALEEKARSEGMARPNEMIFLFSDK